VQWTTSSFSADEDGKTAAKFRKLMGIKAEDQMLLEDHVDISKRYPRMYVYVTTYTYIRGRTDIHRYRYTQSHRSIHTHTGRHTRTYKHTCKHTRTLRHIQTQTHIKTQARTHIYIYSFECICLGILCTYLVFLPY